MSRLINATTMTVDGVTDVGEWYVSEGGHDRAARDQFDGAAGMVLGRKTYEGLAAFWSQQTGEWADMLNPLPKFVVSRTLHGPLEWNATVIEGAATEGVSRLKDELDGDLLLIGCGELARHLLANGLVDEFRFWLHPAIWGRRRTAVPRRNRPDAAHRLDVVRLGRHAPPLPAGRAAGHRVTGGTEARASAAFQAHPTTVVSHPLRFSTAFVSERLP